MVSSQKVVLCTGANQGLGYSIIEVAAEHDADAVYILGCRNVTAGSEAIKRLQGAGLKATFEVIELDVTNDTHITQAAKYIDTKYGRLDVLINNAGALIRLKDAELSTLRKTYNDLLNLHITSVAVTTEAMFTLLRNSPNPEVINITSGLGSIQNTLTKKMGRFPPYGASKVGMNGLTAHLQTGENDRITAAIDVKAIAPKVRFYIVNPGVLKTAFAGYPDMGRDPRLGAETVVRLMHGDYPEGTQWEFVDGEMRQVPW